MEFFNAVPGRAYDQKIENTTVGIRHADNVAKVGTNFTDKRR
jgi:hypothetical protein